MSERKRGSLLPLLRRRRRTHAGIEHLLQLGAPQFKSPLSRSLRFPTQFLPSDAAITLFQHHKRATFPFDAISTSIYPSCDKRRRRFSLSLFSWPLFLFFTRNLKLTSFRLVDDPRRPARNQRQRDRRGCVYVYPSSSCCHSLPPLSWKSASSLLLHGGKGVQV